MRRYRNARYAPESLERKLSPSALFGVMPTMAVATMDGGSPGNGGAPNPSPGTGVPPTLPPDPPSGPGGPA